MRVAVTGSSGLVGSHLVHALQEAGDDVQRLVRRPARLEAGEVAWDPVGGQLDSSRLEGLDGLVHLAGENIASGRWTKARKAAIASSRVHGTKFLCQGLARLRHPPRVLVCASAIGYYGDRGDEPLTESSPPGTGFLAETCQAWEQASRHAQEADIRVMHLRIGVVLSAAGGALAKMLTPFKLGAGGVIGGGRQYMSWVALDDLIRVILHLLSEDGRSGPVNAVAPNPVTNREFTKTLGRILRRPTIATVPAFAARLALGEMADELLLASARVIPQRLLNAGFEFDHPTLEAALRTALERG